MNDEPAELPRGFPNAEFEARTARAQAAMAEAGLAGLLLTTEPEVRYFSGFHTPFWQSPTRPWFLFVGVEGKPVAVIPEIGADLMRRTWLDDVRSWAAPAPNDDGISLLCDLLAPLARSGARLGVPKGHETHLRMPLGDWERLLDRMRGLRIEDATAVVQTLRMVKSDREIAKIARVCDVASRTFERVPALLAEDRPWPEVFRSFRREALAQGADDVPYLVGGKGQGGYRDVISPPGPEPLEPGDVVMLDTGCTWDGHFCDFDRNWAVGRADDASRRVYDVLWRATQAGIDGAQPGVTARAVFQAMSAILAEAGEGGAVGRLGHGLGTQLTEQPSLAGFDGTVLREGMVLTIEPSLAYGNGLTMVHEENIVVRPDGAELLTRRAPRELPIV